MSAERRSLFVASPFRIEVYRQCPRRYKFHYVDGLIRKYYKPRPYFTMGDNVHYALKILFSQVPPEERNYERAATILRARWRRNRRGFASREEESRWGKTALAMLRRFCEIDDLSVMPRFVEDVQETLAAPDLKLMGKIDRVDEHEDGSYSILDYKTGKFPADLRGLIENDMQLTLYSFIVERRTRRPVRTASYLYLRPMRRVTVPTDPDRIDAAVDRLCAMVDQIRRDSAFPASPNRFCYLCDFLEICEAGKKHAESPDSVWAEPASPS